MQNAILIVFLIGAAVGLTAIVTDKTPTCPPAWAVGEGVKDCQR